MTKVITLILARERQTLRQNLNFFQSHGDYVLILSDAHLYRMDYRKFVDYHIAKKADITLAVIPVSERDTAQLGIMKVSDDSKITDFIEKPQKAELLNSLKVSDELLKKATSNQKAEIILVLWESMFLINGEPMVHWAATVRCQKIQYPSFVENTIQNGHKEFSIEASEKQKVIKISFIE